MRRVKKTKNINAAHAGFVKVKSLETQDLRELTFLATR